MTDKETPNYYAIIPASIRYDKSLSNSQKIMFGEITALSQKNGFCHASNNYFADLYDVDPSTVSKWVKGLKDAGYIRVKYDRENKQIKSRKIQPLMDKGGIEINQQGIEKTARGVLKKSQGGIEKTAKYNNTSNNNTSKNKGAREESSLPDKLKEAETIKDLSDIWFTYRSKEKGKWPTLTEREMKEQEIKGWGFEKARKIIAKSMKEGWLSIEEDYLSESKDQKDNSMFDERALMRKKRREYASSN